MSTDDANRGRTSPGPADPGGDPTPEGEAGSGPEMDRLPPPFFPPEEPRSEAVADGMPGEGEAEDAGAPEEESAVAPPEDAFIPPDEPIGGTEDELPDDAFISPDDPFVPADRDEEGMVTSMGDDEAGGPPPPAPPARGDRPTIHELPYLLGSLAERIHDGGARAIQASPEKGHFESALCAFLRGYLRGSED